MSKIVADKVYRLARTDRRYARKSLQGTLVRLFGEEVFPEPSLSMVALTGEIFEGVQPADLELTDFKWEDLQIGAAVAVAWGDGFNYLCFIRKHNMDGFLVTYANEDDELVDLHNVDYLDIKAAGSLKATNVDIMERMFLDFQGRIEKVMANWQVPCEPITDFELAEQAFSSAIKTEQA
jgi:hypothetical protein